MLPAPTDSMPIPDYQSIMLPVLRFSEDQREHTNREAVETLADLFQLTEDERRELLPSGRQTTFHNRVTWAITYLSKAGLLVRPRRAHLKITDRGIAALRQKPSSINVNFLEQYPEFIEFRVKKNNADGKMVNVPSEEPEDQTPEEAIEAAYQRIRNNLAADLLQQIQDCSPAFFERLVVDLLVKMGYGGSRKDAGEAVGKSGDEGIDGIIKEDRLGLDVIYLQAKKWTWGNTVGRPDIQRFVGALQGQRARRGIFITTSSFTKEAQDYVRMIENKVVLIDGEMLAKLMIDHNVGVSTTATYEVKRVDSDYFLEG